MIVIDSLVSILRPHLPSRSLAGVLALNQEATTVSETSSSHNHLLLTTTIATMSLEHAPPPALPTEGPPLLLDKGGPPSLPLPLMSPGPVWMT